MPLTRRQFLTGAAAAGTAAMVAGCAPDWMRGLDEKPTPAAGAAAAGATPAATDPAAAGTIPWSATPVANLTPPSPVALALMRLTFGLRPGDVERVTQMGLDSYIDKQLHPETIDDSAMDSMLAQFPTLNMSSAELMTNYPQPKPQVKADKNATPVPGATPAPKPAARVNGPQDVIAELQQATVLRAAYSERQLYELMVDFWSNHFNINVGKDQDKWLKTVDDREVVRAHALGKFRDLLTASAKSPAMLVYLDNRVSVKGKPNENYAREIMELHTLGVDGGYTYADIQNVARAFTGWTLLPPKRPGDQAGEYVFNAKQHDTDAKTVLGVTIPSGGGENDGLKVIEILSGHPSTAKFIAKKLVRRFVTDNPPDALVAKVAATYQQTDGDIRQMMGVILHSDEFKNSYGQKVRRPLEFITASLRALDVKVDPKDSAILRGVMVLLGQPLFQWLTPDGYPDYASAWINTDGLLSRWNVALNLAQGGPKGISADVKTPTMQAGAKTAADVVDYWIGRLLNRQMAAADRDKVMAYLTGGAANFTLTDAILKTKLPGTVALIMASPDFQYR